MSALKLTKATGRVWGKSFLSEIVDKILLNKNIDSLDYV